jgi:Fic family protein
VRAFHSQTLKALPDTSARNRGKYRAGQNLVVDAATREVRYLPPPATMVPDLMASLIESVNGWRREYPGPVTAAMAHFGLVSIHPFDDGNGRVARLLADLVLALEDWSCDGMLTVNPLLLENRGAYYEVLRQVQGERFQPALDVTPFVEFHTRQLAAAMQRLEERVLRFRRELNEWTARYEFLNQRQITALMFMREIGPLSTSRQADLTESSPATALTDLGALVRAGLAVRGGAGPRTRYRLASPSLASGAGS